MGDNFTIPCAGVQAMAQNATDLNNASIANPCLSCSTNKYASKQAVFQARRPDNCNIYNLETPYPPLPLILSPNQSSNVSWSSYTVARNPMFTYSTNKVNSGGPFERLNMNLYYKSPSATM